MTRPVRLRLRRVKGFDLQALSLATNGLPAVVVTRAGRWGNPYVVGKPVDRRQVRRWGWRFDNLDYVASTAEDAVRRFAACLSLDEAIHSTVRSKLGRRNLACTCDLDAACHAEILLELSNGPVLEAGDAK